MVLEFPAANAPTEQQRWVRAVELAVRQNASAIDSASNRVKNLGSSSKGKQERLQETVSELQKVTSDLQKTSSDLVKTTADLQRVSEYQAGLITVSDVGDAVYSTGDIPSDQTTRWTSNGSEVSVRLRVPTGRLLVGFGCGQITAVAGDSSMIASLRFTYATASAGIINAAGGNTRIFVQDDQALGIPAYSERTIDGLPTNENVTITLEYGSWSSSAIRKANAQFLSPFVRAQVVPA